jgi:glycosyltransferase involved in cell wall biosynthesis
MISVDTNIDVLIVIPVKNEEKFIGSCLNSLINQNYIFDKLRIVVVDHFSSDNTVRIVDDFCKKYNFIELAKKSGGTIASVRNYGANLYKSKYIGFIDGDSIVDDNWINKSIDILLKNKTISCVGYKLAEPIESDPWISKIWNKLSSGSNYSGVCKVQWLSSFNIFIKREYFDIINGFDESLETCEDVDFGKKLSQISDVIFSDEIEVKHLGIVKSIPEFVKKEFWRGKGSLKTFHNSNNKLSDIKGIIIPVFFTLSLIFNLCLLLNFTIFAILFVINIILIHVATSIKIKKRKYSPLVRVQISFVFMLYLIARGFSILIPNAKGN